MCRSCSFCQASAYLPPPPSCKNLAGKLLRFMMPFITVGSTFAIVSGNGIKTFVQAQMHLGYWYLLVLSIFYLLLMPFHLNKQGGTKRKFSIDLLVAFGIWTLLFVANHNLPGGNIWSSQQCFNYWPVFMLGFFCRRYEFTKYAVEHNLIFSVSLIASVAMTIFYLHGYGAILRLIFPFSAITLFMLFYYYRERNLRINRLLEWLGRNSLDIYIYQYLLIWTGLISLPGLGQWFHDTNNVLLELLFTLLGGLMVSTLCIVIGKILRQSKLLRVLVYGEYASKNKYSNVLCPN